MKMKMTKERERLWVYAVGTALCKGLDKKAGIKATMKMNRGGCSEATVSFNSKTLLKKGKGVFDADYFLNATVEFPHIDSGRIEIFATVNSQFNVDHSAVVDFLVQDKKDRNNSNVYDFLVKELSVETYLHENMPNEEVCAKSRLLNMPEEIPQDLSECIPEIEGVIGNFVKFQKRFEKTIERAQKLGEFLRTT